MNNQLTDEVTNSHLGFPTIRVYITGGVVQDVTVVNGSFTHRMDVEIVDDDENEVSDLPDNEITEVYYLNT